MLRRPRIFARAGSSRGSPPEDAAALEPSPGAPPGESPPFPLAEASGAPAAEPAASPRGRSRWRRRLALGLSAALLGALAGAYTQRHTFTAQGADLSRRLIGDENTARIEGWYFRAEDRINRTKFALLGGKTNPFESASVRVDFIPRPAPATYVYHVVQGGRGQGSALFPEIPAPPRPLKLPPTTLLRDNPEPGEGAWSTAGLPRSSPLDPLMAKTFIRPDRSRPYATVGILLVDHRRVRLNITGGTADPGGDRGVKGPGTIPAEAQPKLLAAWNGGFKGPHGGFGMVADGKEYRPLRNGLATIAVANDGSIRMGEWGKDLSWADDLHCVRQNAVLLVQNGEVSRRVSEGNDTWGYVQVNSAEFITWRSAVGLTKDGDLLVAAGNSLSAETLAKALWAAGAHWAMQLDINSPYVLTSMFFPQGEGQPPKAERFMDTMPDAPARFLKTQERDFMYLTLDESRYRH